MDDHTDAHVDPRLEELFHADSPGFHKEDGSEDESMSEALPHWLIGVIVVIILLVIAFFVMVITSLIKNKRKNRSATCSDLNSSSHPCDDLELGKLSQVDPRYQTSTFMSDGKNSVGNNGANSPHEEFVSNSQQASTDASSSLLNSDGSKPLSGCKNPLFVDDTPEDEIEEGDNSNRDGNTNNTTVEQRNRSKDKIHKHKTPTSIVSKDLNSVDEMNDDETVNMDETGVTKMNGTKRDVRVPTSNPNHSNGISISSSKDGQGGQDLIIHQHEEGSSTTLEPPSDTVPALSGNPDEVNNEVQSKTDLDTNHNVPDVSSDSQGERINDAVTGERIHSDESCDQEEVGQMVNGMDPQPANIPVELENAAKSKSDLEPEPSRVEIQEESDSTPSDCNGNHGADVKEMTENLEQGDVHDSFVTIALDDVSVSELETDGRTYTKL